MSLEMMTDVDMGEVEVPEEEHFERSPLLQRTRSLTISQALITENQYTSQYIEGFKIKFQGELSSNQTLVNALTEDLHVVVKNYLPDHVVRTLHDFSVKIWVHQDRDYCSCGDDRSLAGCNFFQCGKDVVNNNRNITMNGHVELICEDYLLHREKWGLGGLLLHEFVHAYDFHCLSSDHSKKLKEVFEQTRSLYEERNPNAATNVGEFFAELSVAYLAKDVNHIFPKSSADIDPESLAVIEAIWTKEREF